MSQQDFLKWAERKVRAGRGVTGRLDLSELPDDLRISVPDVQRLHQELSARIGGVDLILTDNRRRMVSVKKKKKRYRMRLHHMFVGCDGETCAALAELAGGSGEVADPRRIIKQYIAENRDEISFDIDPEDLESRGDFHDLQTLLDKWRDWLDDEILDDVVITWGRYGKGQRSIRFGSFDFDRKLIRIHPALDKEWVPPFFVEFIVYHELLHALFPPVKKSSQRVVHTPEFRRREEQFPRYDEAIAWERKNLSRFMER